jgi:hypothetical protein
VIVLVLVCIGTATLFVVLAVELGRLMLGAEREGVAVDRLLHRVAGDLKGVPGAMPDATVRSAARSPEGPVAGGPPTVAERSTSEAADQTWVRHDLEVEQLVRDRLYGAQSLRERRD